MKLQVKDFSNKLLHNRPIAWKVALSAYEYKISINLLAKEDFMKHKSITLFVISITCCMLFGCGNKASSTPNAEESTQINESTSENDTYNNIISDATKKHANSFLSLDDQYHSWRGTHVNNKFEYAWVTVEPYVSQMDAFVAANDNVDWSLVEASSKFDESTFDAIAEAGYNFVRIPLDTRFFFTDDEFFNVDSTGETWKGDIKTHNETNWQDLDRAIAWCIDRDIHVCIDVHSTPGGFMIGGDEEESRKGLFDENNKTYSDILLEFWKQAANRYKDIDEKALSFNLYNEPPTFIQERQDDYADLMCEAISIIREISPQRLIFIDTLNYSTCGFDNIEKFSGIDNLIFSFHYYSNYQWSTGELLNENWKNECEERISGYNNWAKANGVKWMLQEYGIQSDIHDLNTRLEFIQYVTQCVSGYEIPYCHYGFLTGTPFNLYDGENVISSELVDLTTR